MTDNAVWFRRREFFREALGGLLRPAADFLARRMEPGHEGPFLRPPGAIDEPAFSAVCQRCGKCVEICPAKAIFPLGDHAGDAAGTPAINPDLAACVVCDGLKCTTVCPSGALLPLLHPQDIRMGLAEVRENLCVRTHGESCTVCVDLCPLGESAIRFTGDGPPQVSAEGCVGCGVCQLYCPTRPRAIVVQPWDIVDSS